MAHGLPRPARLALAAVKVAVVAAIVAIGFGAQPDPVTSPGPDFSGYASESVADRSSRAEALLEAHRCSESGFAGGQQPTSALVRSAHGRLRFVDFDTGWEIYTRHGEATLIAVCLDDPPTA